MSALWGCGRRKWEKGDCSKSGRYLAGSVPTVFQKPLLKSHAKFAKYAKFPLGDGSRTTEYTEYTEGGWWSVKCKM